MILESAILDVRNGQTKAFEKDFNIASKIIASMKGYKEHSLQRCIENKNRYLLLVQWESLESHTIGFRKSSEYQEWKNLLHHYYEPFPTMEHFESVFENKA